MIEEMEVELKPGRDGDGTPYCLDHHCRMVQTSGGGKGKPRAYFKCPVNGCGATGTRIKKEVYQFVPKEPTACGRCSRGDAKVFKVRDAENSSASKLVMVCPSCGARNPAVATPELAAAALRRTEPRNPNLGDR